VREIRTLRAMWRVLETEPRQFLTGHEEGNLGYMPRKSLRATAPVPDPTERQLIICARLVVRKWRSDSALIPSRKERRPARR